MAGRDNENGNRRGAWVALIALAVIFAIGWVLVRQLYTSQQLENCLLSRRTNCMPVETSPR